MAQKKTKEGMSAAEKVGVGFGLTTAAVAAAGAYFLYGSKQASQNRKKVKGWMLKAKGEVLEALEKAQAITEDEYRELVATASRAYGTVKSASSTEVKDFQKEMQEHWAKLQKSNALKKIVAPKPAPAKKAQAKPVTKTVAPKTVSVAKTTPKKAPAKKVASK